MTNCVVTSWSLTQYVPLEAGWNETHWAFSGAYGLQKTKFFHFLLLSSRSCLPERVFQPYTV